MRSLLLIAAILFSTSCDVISGRVMIPEGRFRINEKVAVVHSIVVKRNTNSSLSITVFDSVKSAVDTIITADIVNEWSLGEGNYEYETRSITHADTITTKYGTFFPTKIQADVDGTILLTGDRNPVQVEDTVFGEMELVPE